MKTETVLRAVAVMLALTGLVDPSCTRTAAVPIPVQVIPGSGVAADRALAASVERHLADELGDAIDLHSAAPPAALIVAGSPLDLQRLPSGVPISIVTAFGAGARNVRVTGLTASSVALTAAPLTVVAQLQAVGVAGERSRLALEAGGVELEAREHRWQSAAESVEARFEYMPLAPGPISLRVSARPLEGEAAATDNHADMRLSVEDRKLRVLVHEPRPSWAATFLRRALESDPLLEVSGLVRPSRGIEIQVGRSPDRLTESALEPVEVVVVGAPEELREAEVEALEWFVRLRGGTLILVPDRRPSGPYVRLVPARGFEEALLETPVEVSFDGSKLRGSEFVVPQGVRPGARTVGAIQHGGRAQPVALAWPAGIGQVIFSGALDAWRYRAQAGDYDRFWRGTVTAGALAAPRPLDVRLEPDPVQRGQRVRVLVRLRPSELARGSAALSVPPVSAAVADPAGGSNAVRLWPTAEAGQFEGTFEPDQPGGYAIRAAAGTVTGASTLMVLDSARTAGPASTDIAGLVAAATGGRVAAATDLSGVADHLRSLPAATAAQTLKPARSVVWAVSFVLLLAAEWYLRRRRGAA